MLKKPSLLKKGDRIGIVAPSRVILKVQIEKALEVFETWGLQVTCSDHLFARDGYFAGSDEQRKTDLQHMFSNPDIKAIFCARGGYGMTRIIDEVDVSPLLDNPKWIIGFSDITAMHLALNQSGIESIHGLMPVQFNKVGVEESLGSLHDLLFKGDFQYSVPTNPLNKCGAAEAEIIGGNLSLVAESLGTRTEINTEGKVLFLEEIDEYLYKIDRMFMQLRRAGKLDKLAGLIVGTFSHVKDTQIPFGKSIYELIDYHVGESGFPVAYDFPVGHEAKNLAIPCGRKVRLEVMNGVVTLSDKI